MFGKMLTVNWHSMVFRAALSAKWRPQHYPARQFIHLEEPNQGNQFVARMEVSGAQGRHTPHAEISTAARWGANNLDAGERCIPYISCNMRPLVRPPALHETAICRHSRDDPALVSA